MEKRHAARLLEESVRFELNASDLYMLYYEHFRDDSGFWWQLSIEEKNHASLLKSGELYLQMGKLPEEILVSRLELITQANKEISDFIRKFKDTPLSKPDAYQFALAIEESAVEMHYQKLMKTESESKVVNIFQQLGKFDLNHAQRIRGLMDN